MFKSRPNTHELAKKLRKINNVLPGPYNPEELGEMMIEGVKKLDLEAESTMKIKEPYLVEINVDSE